MRAELDHGHEGRAAELTDVEYGMCRSTQRETSLTMMDEAIPPRYQPLDHCHCKHQRASICAVARLDKYATDMD
ncbi:MAG: hypothetical protein C3F10_11555 [Dehalococcoidia bacterium]|nr:MAG: hypothetical protein C3F10_11555 [Dehalococcoidia bacterium]